MCNMNNELLYTDGQRVTVYVKVPQMRRTYERSAFIVGDVEKGATTVKATIEGFAAVGTYRIEGDKLRHG